MGKKQTPEEKAAAAEKKAAKKAAEANLANEQAAEEQTANDKQQENESEESVSPVENAETLPETTNPDGGSIPTTEEGDSNQVGNEISSEEETKAKKLAVVIPYLKAAAQGKELLYAIRSLAKNFREDFVVVVIGDKEDWFSDEILHIEHACMSRNPQADVVDKIKQILIDERISESFVWSNDDIYFVTPTTLEDIQKPKTAGELIFNPSEKGIYNSNRGETIKALQSKGYPARNFSTHLPFFFEKEKMIQVFETFPRVADGLLLSSVYFNMHVDESEPTDHIDGIRGPWLLRIISQLETEEKKKKFRELIPKKHFLNHSEAGYSALLMDWIGSQFPDKCRFEK